MLFAGRRRDWSSDDASCVQATTDHPRARAATSSRALTVVVPRVTATMDRALLRAMRAFLICTRRAGGTRGTRDSLEHMAAARSDSIPAPVAPYTASHRVTRDI